VTTVDMIPQKAMTSDGTQDGVRRFGLLGVVKPGKKSLRERDARAAAWSTPRTVGRPLEGAVDREPEMAVSGRFRWK